MVVFCIAVLCAFSVAYAFYNGRLNASTPSYHAGGNVTGRINKAPSNLNVKNLEFQKGDRVLLGTMNPELGEPIAVQLIDQSTYSNYNCPTYTVACTQSKEITSWLSLTTKAIAHSTTGIDLSDFSLDTVFESGTSYADFTSSYLSQDIDSLNSTINVNDLKILTYPNGNAFEKYLNRTVNPDAGLEAGLGLINYRFNKRGFYLVETEHYGFGATLANDLKFSENYWGGQFYNDNKGRKYVNYYIVGSTGRPTPYGSGVETNSALESKGLKYAIRPYTDVDVSNSVFGIGMGTSSGIGNISIPLLNSNYTALYTDAVGLPMKVRIENDILTDTTGLMQIQNTSGTTITKTTKDVKILLNATAQSGNDGYGGIYTVSALIFNEKGDFVYYKPLESAKGSGTYEFDLSGIAVGKYKIGIVNEAYNENSAAPADSSKITDVLPLEIVEPVSISVTPKTGLEFSKNVNNGDMVATYTTSNGVNPISVSVASDTSVLGHDNDYQKFTISGNNVVVNDPNGLHAGDYYFKLNAVDANGDPMGGVNSNTVHIVVAETNLTVAFDDPNQTKKSIAQAISGWSEKASVTPSIGAKVTYSKSGGSVGIINLDPDTGAITYTGGTAYGKITIKATADDDPSSGFDDYQSSEVTKEIVIYREIDGNVTPHANSSDSTIPTFKTSDANIKPNGIIGTIHGTLGTPDNITSGTTTYTYGLKNVDDHSYFSVDKNTGIIKTTADLSATTGTYQITVTVSDKWSTKEISVTINVGMAPAENLKFYENATSNTMITSKSASLTDTGVSVYATVKGSSNNNPVTYRLKDGEPTNVIDVNPNSGAVTIKNVGTVVIIAEKQGSGGQADAITELTFTVTAGSQEFIYTDASGNELPKSGNSYDDHSEVYGQGKTFQLYTAGNPPGSTVTYALQAGSPTDVISVDPNGLVSIYNASMNTQIGKVIVEATSHDPTGNYSDKTIELPITITKANQTISFKDVTPAQSGKGKVTPVIITQDISSNEGGVSVNDTSYYITIDPSIPTSLAWTSNGIDIEYNYDKEEGIEIPLHVEKAGNRNYNKAEANGKMRILGPDESTLTINRPGKIVYGDHFTLRSLQDDSSSSNVNYTFEVDNTIFVSSPTVKGNLAEFDALKCSDGSKINITVTRTADSEVTLSKVVTIEVLPKDINIVIDDKIKQKGEENPELTFQDFTSQLVSWNDVQDVVDLNDVVLSTTATTTSKAGSYPITGNTKTMNTTYSNYNFIFKEGKLMVDSNIDKDVDDDGKPDFNDPDGDGCPDLNIKWKDDDGNWVIINGDRDYDGIPDLNIDSDGDGIPDLNIDADNDGKPDINLVILKKSDWKPTKCVVQSATVKEEYCTGTNAKPQINVDTDSDNIPNINIDTNGDMKADFNISKDGKNPNINIGKIHAWTPDQDYTVNQFTYDTISKENAKPEINIDTDGDGRPDLNLDLDNDGIPDMNIDGDGDGIPDVNIDTTGDGKPNINIDTDNDGKPDENIVEIQEWKPSKDGNKDGFLFDTMEIEQKTELEDNGIKVEKPDGTSFLPNFALKVEDVTNTKQTEITTDAKEFIEEKQEVKKVYDVKLLKDGVEVQPDGMIKVKIPYEGINNPILIRKNNNGSYEKIHYTIEKGYLVYETEELGIVSIIGDKETNTSVMGTYTPNIGGALTGDETGIHLNLLLMFISFLVLMILKSNKQKDTFQ